MNVLLKNALILSPGSPHNGKRMDILIKNDKIESIKKNIKIPGVKEISSKSLHVSPGWMDSKVNFRDPGAEYKEDIHSGLLAAAAGGFTAVAHMPTTLPVMDSKSGIEYLINKSLGNAVNIYPVGSITKNSDGKELAELFDMQNAGAIAFSDDKNELPGSLMTKGLLYVKNFNGLIVTFPFDKNLSNHGNVHEGKVSTMMGLKGIPAISEEAALQRDIEILRYTNSRMHVSGISTKGSVDILRKAKKSGLRISAEVYIHNVIFTDENVNDFDTNYKVLPPLRSTADQKAIIKGLKDGTIDNVCSDHSPEDVENKDLEFSRAAYGMTGLETAYASLNELGDFNQKEIVSLLALNPRKIFGIKIPEIEEGAVANLTVFDPEITWTYSEKEAKSKSNNSPLFGKSLKGKCLGIYNRGHWVA